ERAGTIGRLAEGLRARASRVAGGSGDRASFWTRWTETVMRRPVLSVLLASAIMIALAIPVLQIHLDESAIAQFPNDNEARTGTLVAARAFGPGRLGPVQELVTFRQGTARSSGNSRALAAHVAFVRRLPQVAAVDPPA